MNCSDYSTSYVCRTCGSLLSVGLILPPHPVVCRWSHFDDDRHDDPGYDADLGPKRRIRRFCRRR